MNRFVLARLLCFSVLGISVLANAGTAFGAGPHLSFGADDYPLFKQELIKELRRQQDDNVSAWDWGVPTGPGRDTISLSSCGDVSGAAGYNTTPSDWNSKQFNDANNLQTLAYEVAEVQTILDSTKYPTDVWKTTLDNFEVEQLKIINKEKTLDDDILNTLAKKLNEYRKANPKLNLPVMTADADGCGADELTLIVKPSEKAKRIQIINVIFVEICQHHGVDPFDPKCPYAEDYGVGGPNDGEDGGIMASGQDLIQVTWRDGTTTRRNVPVDQLMRGKDGDEAYYSIMK